MVNASFEVYCDAVCRRVRYIFARPAIREELTAHLEDRAEALCQAGVSPEEAAEQAVSAMGDPEGTGRALDRAHPPVLSLAAALTKTAAMLLAGYILLLCCLPLLIAGVRSLVDNPVRALPTEMVVWSTRPNALLRAGGRFHLVTDLVRTTDGALHISALQVVLTPEFADTFYRDPQVLDREGNSYWGGGSTTAGWIARMSQSISDFPEEADAVILRFLDETGSGSLTLPLGEVTTP